jgi:hypothetical protein
LSTFTYTNAYTRAEAVVDQVAVLFTQAGVSVDATTKICKGVASQWLEAVGLYLARPAGRVYEIEAAISWPQYATVPSLEFSTDLPGWEERGSPEALVLGRRIAGIAKDEGLEVSYWGRFSAEIRREPARHQILAPQVGLQYGGRVPDWSGSPQSVSIRLQDLSEISAQVRSTL